jgi:hypothetical protein
MHSPGDAANGGSSGKNDVRLIISFSIAILLEHPLFFLLSVHHHHHRYPKKWARFFVEESHGPTISTSHYVVATSNNGEGKMVSSCLQPYPCSSLIQCGPTYTNQVGNLRLNSQIACDIEQERKK